MQIRVDHAYLPISASCSEIPVTQLARSPRGILTFDVDLCKPIVCSILIQKCPHDGSWRRLRILRGQLFAVPLMSRSLTTTTTISSQRWSRRESFPKSLRSRRRRRLSPSTMSFNISKSRWDATDGFPVQPYLSALSEIS